jgi:SOS-response transcriptional repressor LexA
MHFGGWIKERREKLEMTQATLAHRMGVSLATIRNWEHAERMPRLSAPIKAALADALRMSLPDLDAIGRGERREVAFEPEATGKPDVRRLVKIENWERAKGHLKGVATLGFTVHDGFLSHKCTSKDTREFAWIVEDDSMVGIDGYSIGDVVVFTESKNVPAGSDVMVYIHGRCLGMVRRAYYQDDRVVLVALNRKYEPRIVSLKDLTMKAGAVAIFRAL